MTHNRENLRLSLHDLQQTTTAPINSSSCSSSNSQSMSVLANQAITTVANKFSRTPASTASSVTVASSGGSGGGGGVGSASVGSSGIGINVTCSLSASSSSSSTTNYQNDKCERLKKMTSITCSDSEDDSERRVHCLDGGSTSSGASCGVGLLGGVVGVAVGTLNKWNIGGFEGVS